MPKSIRKIDSFAFGNCKKLKKIQGVEYVSEIGEEIFCSVKDGRGDFNISTHFLYKTPVVILASTLIRCNGGELSKSKKAFLEIPEGVTKICKYAFRDGNPESVYIPASVEIIEDCAFKTSFLKTIKVDSNNKNYCSVNGMLLSKDQTELLFVPGGQEAELEIPAGVKTIRANATHFAKLTSLVFPDTLETIGKEAFNSCKNLKTVVFPKNMKNIETYAFWGCGNLESIEFPESMESIGQWAFYECARLEAIILPKHLRSIGYGAFEKTGLKAITLPETLEHIAAKAFAETHISEAVIPKSVQTIGWGAFSGTPEIVVYDSIDPQAKDADRAIDFINGHPNSLVGYIGIGPDTTMCGKWECATNHFWLNHTITVKSAETDEIKYKVWMGADSSQKDYYCFLSSAWGHNATFAFEYLDRFFPKIRGEKHKLQVAKYRLEYPYALSDAAMAQYKAYVEKMSGLGNSIANRQEGVDFQK